MPRNQSEQVDSEFSHLPPFDSSLSEDETVVMAFANKIQSKLDRKTLNPTDQEKKVLKNAVLFPGIFYGSAVTLGTFLLFRKAPVYILNRIKTNQHTESFVKAKKMKQDISVSPSSSTTTTTSVSKLNGNANTPTLVEVPPQEKFRESPVTRVVGTFFDATVSLFLGLMGFTAYLDKKKVLNTAADIPLMEGKSKISDSLCDDFIHIYHDKIRKEFWQENTDDTVTAISRFVANCEKRHLYERKLRRERGLIGSDDVELPSAVSEDIVKEEEERYKDSDWAALDDFDEE